MVSLVSNLVQEQQMVGGHPTDMPLGEVARLRAGNASADGGCFLPMAAEPYEKNQDHEKNIEHVHHLHGHAACGRGLAHFRRPCAEGPVALDQKALKRVRGCGRGTRSGRARQTSDRSRGRARCHLESDLRASFSLAGKSQEPMIKTHHRLRERRFRHRIQGLVRRTRWRDEDEEPEPSYAVARQIVSPLVADFLAASEIGGKEVAVWHRFRIKGKRLRYALELFSGAVDSSLTEIWYPLIEEVQERLGAISTITWPPTALSRGRKSSKMPRCLSC